MAKPYNRSDISVGRGFAAITASDSTVFDPPYRAVFVGTGGTLYVDGLDSGSNVPFKVPSGGMVPGWVTRVYATGLTAADLVGVL